MILTWFIGSALWFLYYSAYEISLRLTDRKAKKTDHLVLPELKTLSALRYNLFLVATLFIVVATGVLAYYLHPLLINILIVNVVTILVTPIVTYVLFNIFAKHLIYKAKREKLMSKIDNNK